MVLAEMNSYSSSVVYIMDFLFFKQDTINQIKWLGIIMDESHKIKEPKSGVTKAAKSVKCKCRIGLTGTPLQNNMQEFW